MTTIQPDYKKARRKAEDLLAKLMIADAPIISSDVASELGLSVYEVDMPKGLEGIAGFVDFDNNEVIVNKADSVFRKNFTIAHEIGHFVLHRDKILESPGIYKALLRTQNLDGDNSILEKEANCFAAELLTPKYILEKYRGIPDSIKSKIFMISPLIFKFRPK